MKMPLLKKLSMGALATVLFFLLLEGLLALGGVQPKLYSSDPYLGFSSNSPLFVRDHDSEGRAIYRVADNKLSLFNPQQFPAKKKSGTIRIFCVGGSTTYGRPFGDATSFCGWLRVMLPAADPSRHWEVINAGGVSYASYRVALLMEELSGYEPDLFIIYSGQNEFLEARTYRSVIAMPRALRGLGALAAHTRTWTFMEDLIKKEEGSSSQTEAMLGDEVKTKLDASIGPSAYHRNRDQQEKTVEHFHFNLLRMIDIARGAAGAAALLVVPAANLGDCTPFKSEHRSGLDKNALHDFDSAMLSARQAALRGRLEEALTDLQRARALDGNYAGELYNEGRILRALGRWDEAREAFEKARDEDVCPLRILGEMTDVVRRSAMERGVPLVDFDAAIRQRSEHGIPGKDLFLDHVHPTIEGNFLLARLIFDDLKRQGIVRPGAGWGDAEIEAVRARVMASIDDTQRGLALTKLSKVLGWAGKLREADVLAWKAVKLSPDSSSSWYQAGLTAQLQGQKKRAEQAYRRCLKLQPDADLPRQNLGVLLQQKGDYSAAIHEFRQAIRLAREPETVSANRKNLADALFMLGSLQYRQERFEDAVKSLQESDDIHPGRAETLSRLGLAELAMKQNEEAIQNLEKAVEKAPESGVMHNRLAIGYAAAGRLEDARREWAEALSRSPELKAHPKISSAFRIPSARQLRPGLNREILNVDQATPPILLNRPGQICGTSGRVNREVIFARALKDSPNSAPRVFAGVWGEH